MNKCPRGRRGWPLRHDALSLSCHSTGAPQWRQLPPTHLQVLQHVGGICGRIRAPETDDVTGLVADAGPFQRQLHVDDPARVCAFTDGTPGKQTQEQGSGGRASARAGANKQGQAFRGSERRHAERLLSHPPRTYMTHPVHTRFQEI